jgi:hypothetical protein
VKSMNDLFGPIRAAPTLADLIQVDDEDEFQRLATLIPQDEMDLDTFKYCVCRLAHGKPESIAGMCAFIESTCGDERCVSLEHLEWRYGVDPSCQGRPKLRIVF